MSRQPGPEFWRLLDATRLTTDDPEAHANAITERLTAQGVDTTLAFVRDWDEAMSALYNWDLWGAAYLALGGCSDDAFQYLRAWLVANGESTWARAQLEPEALFLDLLANDRRQADVFGRVDHAEHLLYAAGRAHEALAGSWPEAARPEADEPEGEAWEETDLPSRFPDLYRAVESEWEAERAALAKEVALARAVSEGLDAAATGNHGRAEEILRPLFDDPDSWAVISANSNSRAGVAYVLGIGDLLAGRVDRAAETFRRVVEDIGEHDELRRGLAQVELARGHLDAAGDLLDSTPQAPRFDRILTAKLLWRRGDIDDAVTRALGELGRPTSKDDHPWDVAGALLQAGHILIEAGLMEEARRAAKAMKSLLRGAPSDLELVVEWRLLTAAVDRLRGKPGRALAQIAAIGEAKGYTKATWHRERGRTLHALGQDSEAREELSRAIELLTEAGERWEAAALREELDDLGA